MPNANATNATNGNGTHSPAVPCPRCQGPTWDNRHDKKTAKSPDYRCKDPECGGSFWLSKPRWSASTAVASRVIPPPPLRSESAAAAAPGSFAHIAQLHARCLQFVVKNEAPMLAGQPGDVARALSALAGGLFIELSRKGTHA